MVIELTDDEALVLSALLAEYGTRDDGRTLAIAHAAERNALWALEAALEKQLVAPLRSDYAELLLAARRRVEEQGGPWEL
jgi:hypothetical protein